MASPRTPGFTLRKQRQRKPSPAVRAAFNNEEEMDVEEQRRLADLCFPKKEEEEGREQRHLMGVAELTSSAPAAAVTAEAKEARAAALKERGNVVAEAGDIAGALCLFEQAIGLLGPTTTGRGLKIRSTAHLAKPHDELSARLWELKAQCHLHLEEYLEAVKAAERAVELSDARWPEAKLTLGRCLLQFGEVRAAVKVLTELFGSDPSNEEVRGDLIEANAVLSELVRREEDFDLQLSGRAGLDARELEVCACKRNLLARGVDVPSDCTLGMTEEEESAVALDRARREAVEQEDDDEEDDEVEAAMGRISTSG